MLTVVSVVTNCHQNDYNIIDCTSYVVRFTPMTSLSCNLKSVLPNPLHLFWSSLHCHLPLATLGLFSAPVSQSLFLFVRFVFYGFHIEMKSHDVCLSVSTLDFLQCISHLLRVLWLKLFSKDSLHSRLIMSSSFSNQPLIAPLSSGPSMHCFLYFLPSHLH